jgi:hypothetical protein
LTLLDLLLANKGTVSSALGKQLAIDVLAGDRNILKEAAELIHHESKNVRSGSAKIIEKVAEEQPELVAPLLPDLIAAFDHDEPQTKWIMIHTFGLCAKFQPEISREVFDTATQYLEPSFGTCLRDRAITYLGYVGSLSKKDCDKCFPLLIESFTKHPDRITRVYESLERLADLFDSKQKQIVNSYFDKHSGSKSLEIKKWAKKLSKKTNSDG